MTRQDIRDIVNKTTAYSFMGRKVARTRWSNVLCNGPTQTEVCSTENPDGSHVVSYTQTKYVSHKCTKIMGCVHRVCGTMKNTVFGYSK